MVHGALQQSLESLRRFVEDGIPACVVFAAWIRCEGLGTRFGPSAVGAWPVLTDAILTELSGRHGSPGP
jgi:hypothetical protein